MIHRHARPARGRPAHRRPAQDPDGMAGGKSRSWLHMICVACIIAVTVDVILDLECPRVGLIRVDAFDQALVDQRSSMN